MAAIALRIAGVLIFCSLRAFADQAADVLQQINHVTSGLADGNPTDAMVPFDKSFGGYEQLLRYFTALTNSFQITTEADVLDEQDAGNESRLTLRWTMTLTSQSTDETERRSREVRVRLVLHGKDWKIAELSPIELFDPEMKSSAREH